MPSAYETPIYIFPAAMQPLGRAARGWPARGPAVGHPRQIDNVYRPIAPAVEFTPSQIIVTEHQKSTTREPPELKAWLSQKTVQFGTQEVPRGYPGGCGGEGEIPWDAR